MESLNPFSFGVLPKLFPDDQEESDGAVEHPWLKEPIFSARNIECGHFSWQIYQNHEELGGGFDRYISRIPGAIWPLAVLRNIYVEKRFRNRKNGQNGVRQFINDAKEKGAVCAILKIGWSERNWKKQRAKNLHVYQTQGFVLLEDENPNMVDVSDIMYRKLDP